VSLLRLINVQGFVGLAVSLGLAVLLVVQKIDARHWQKQSAQFERLYRTSETAFAETVADYRAAAERARAADEANLARVTARQRAITERTEDEFEARLADARARAERMRVEASRAAADPGGRAVAPMSGLPAAARGAAQAAGQDGLSRRDRLTATEQAIQLDELIEWVRAQAKVDRNAPGAH
jgi:hypothetical protein